jgi:hypothetical protein
MAGSTWVTPAAAFSATSTYPATAATCFPRSSVANFRPRRGLVVESLRGAVDEEAATPYRTYAPWTLVPAAGHLPGFLRRLIAGEQSRRVACSASG